MSKEIRNLWSAPQTTGSYPGLIFYVSKHGAGLWHLLKSTVQICLKPSCTSSALLVLSPSHPCLMLGLIPCCGAASDAQLVWTEDKNSPSQSSHSQFSFHHHHSVPHGAMGHCFQSVLSTPGLHCPAPTLSVQTAKSSTALQFAEWWLKTGKTQSSAEEALYACFGLLTTKGNKIYIVENDAKVTGAPVHHHKRMINKKFLFH